MSYKDEAALGRINKARGVISDMIIWTLDNKDEYSRYYDAGARGIITNNLNNIMEWVRDNGCLLYTSPSPRD